MACWQNSRYETLPNEEAVWDAYNEYLNDSNNHSPDVDQYNYPWIIIPGVLETEELEPWQFIKQVLPEAYSNGFYAFTRRFGWQEME